MTELSFRHRKNSLTVDLSRRLWRFAAGAGYIFQMQSKVAHAIDELTNAREM
jgi:hypothetical protein